VRFSRARVREVLCVVICPTEFVGMAVRASVCVVSSSPVSLFWCQQVATAGPLSFDDFLSGDDGADSNNSNNNSSNNIDGSFPAVNFVLKYEQLDDDLLRLLRLLGVEQTEGAGAALAELVRACVRARARARARVCVARLEIAP
jgi:hypothetical protein